MAFYSASFSGTTYPTAFMSTLDTWLTTSSWQFVESVGTVSGSFANVYKSSSLTNSLAKDFYMATYRTASVSVGINFRLFEQWDATNKKALKYAPSYLTASTASVNPSDKTIVDSVGQPLNSASFYTNSNTTYTANIQTIYADIDIDKIILGSNLAAHGNSHYIGVYDTLVPTSLDPVPLVISMFGGTTGTAATLTSNTSTVDGGASTREPNQTLTASGNFHIFTYINGVNSNYVIFNQGEPNTVGSLYRGLAPYSVTRMMFYSLRPIVVGTSNPVSNYRGVYKDIVTSNGTGNLVQADIVSSTNESGSVKNYIATTIFNNNVVPTVLIRTS